MQRKQNPVTEIRITIQLRSCAKCPFVASERTPGTGYALDYYCTKAQNKKIMGYVEWERDEEPVPDWCPYIVKEKKEPMSIETRRFIHLLKEEENDT